MRIKQLFDRKVRDLLLLGPEKFAGLSRNGPQAPVVRKVDNAIHLINHYPVDSVVCFVNTYPLDSDLSDG